MKSLDEIAELLRNQPGKPPLEKWHPDVSGDIDIVIQSDGRWFHEGGEIKRHELVKLFASILRREEDEHYYLVTPVEKWRIRVEDQALIIIDVELAEDRVALNTNTGEWVLLGEKHALSVESDPDSGEPHPVVSLERGLSAKVGRAVFYRLVESGREEDGQLWLYSDGRRFSLGKLEE